MHDAHDHVVALSRLLELAPGTMIKSLLDLELAYESLGGNAFNSFGDALWAVGLCEDPGRSVLCDTKDKLVYSQIFNVHALGMGDAPLFWRFGRRCCGCFCGTCLGTDLVLLGKLYALCLCLQEFLYGSL